MDKQYIITISHQLGCGGAYIGQKLSEQLNVPFVDRQILKKAADYLGVPEDDIEKRDERMTSIWEIITRVDMFSDPLALTPIEYFPTDKDLFKLESDYIEKISEQGPAIILGRGGRYILRDHPRHLSVFIYAGMKDRISNVSKLYNVDGAQAKKIIEKNDKARSAYMKAFTKLDWLDLRSYDICINTSSTGLDNAVSIIKGCIDFKFIVN